MCTWCWWEERQCEKSLVNKTKPWKDWAWYWHFDTLKKKAWAALDCKPHEMMKKTSSTVAYSRINTVLRWCLSASTCLIDPVLNGALRTGCLRLTPADNLPIFAGIKPAELRRKRATLSLERRAIEPGHMLHSALTCRSSGNARYLKSRHPSLSAAQQLISPSDNRSAALWTDHRWNGWRTLRDSALSLPISAPNPLE